VDEHRDERWDLQYYATARRAAGQVQERRQEDSGGIVDEASEVVGRVGADELEQDAQSNKNLDGADEQPDHLGNLKDLLPVLASDILDGPFAVCEAGLIRDNALALLDSSRTLSSLLRVLRFIEVSRGWCRTAGRSGRLVDPGDLNGARPIVALQRVETFFLLAVHLRMGASSSESL